MNLIEERIVGEWNTNDNAWQENAGAYRCLIQDSELDSKFIREAGLIPNLVSMIGSCHDATLLDAGCGSAWLAERISPARAFACDLVAPESLPSNVAFSIEDVHALSYPTGMFDVVVASLLLFYCEDLQAACNELYRVSKADSKLIVSLMHPYFYRTGSVEPKGEYRISADLSAPFAMTFKIGERVGPLVYHYRPLPAYVNALVRSGWQITEMRDWCIDMHQYRKQAGSGMKSRVRRTGLVPLFNFIKCQRI